MEGTELDALTRLYADLDPRHRAQGSPPRDPDAVREWLADRPGLHLVARHDGRAGGHELVVFVHQSYHDAGIGTRLLGTLLERAPRPASRRSG